MKCADTLCYFPRLPCADGLKKVCPILLLVIYLISIILGDCRQLYRLWLQT